MKKAIIATISVVLILAAVAVGVTAYASDGYTLPVEQWGERLGIDSDKQPEEQEKPDDTMPGGEIPGGDTQTPDEEIPGDSTEEPNEEESEPVFTQFENRRYFLSENGEETKSNALPLKEMFEDLQPVADSGKYFLNIELQDSNSPGQIAEGGIVIKMDYFPDYYLGEGMSNGEMLSIYYVVGNGEDEGKIKMAAFLSASAESGERMYVWQLSDEWASDYGVGFVKLDGHYMAHV